MRLNPEKIADEYIQKHGFDNALEKVLGETKAAQAINDNFALSVLRDVKRILREREGLAVK